MDIFKICFCLILTLQFAFAQDSYYNYANLNTTKITCELEESDKILDAVDADLDYNAGPSGFTWVKFEFERKIEIDEINLNFHELTCLENCKLNYKIILDDLEIIDSISQFHNSISINHTSKKLILVRLQVYPSGPASINKVSVISTTAPINEDFGIPKIDGSTRETLKVMYEINGFSRKEIKYQNKLWKTRYKFYKNHLKNNLPDYRQLQYENLFTRQWKDFCYDMIDGADWYYNLNILKELHEQCDCDLKEEYFLKGLSATKKMFNELVYLHYDTLNYRDPNVINIIRKNLKLGGAIAGHVVPHIALLGMKSELPKVIALKNDSNVFAQYQSLLGCLYFSEKIKAKEIGELIISREKKSIQNDSIAVYGIYALKTLKALMEVYPEFAFAELDKLYHSYRSLYPKKMGDAVLWTDVFYLDVDQKVKAGVRSMQGVDERILEFVNEYLNYHPENRENLHLQKLLNIYNERMDFLKSKGYDFYN